ncbi:hypothetical protein EW146_g6827 [Bondarzewia mesenterica]|uniref:Alpha/beta hydrolase fold-3 domain-containing protein n=1 Tax=Bondarzewia mesenterica TaxID=1095465 RepID=A0A4V3XEF6_9AGAM|nr:hypothetical protein EW146_g6827 [Bondarzewia mesenterica]
MAQHAHFSTTDPELAPLLAGMPSALEANDLTTARQRYTSLISVVHRRLGPILPKSIAFHLLPMSVDCKLPVEGGGITARTLVPTPAGAEETTFPLMVWYHGGGWSVGSLDLDDDTLRLLCVKLQISIVSVNYRLAPEHPFPTGINDAYATLKWASEQIESLSVDLSKGFIVAGQSAGANLAAVVTLRARDDLFFKDRPITGQILHYPSVVHMDAVPEKYKSELLSMEQNKDAPGLTRKDMEFYISLTKPPPTDPDFSPLLAASHANLPPLCMQVCGLDPLRDEGILYEKVLRESGVKTKLHVYPGAPHGFHLIFPDTKVSAQFDRDFTDAIKWILSMSA